MVQTLGCVYILNQSVCFLVVAAAIAKRDPLLTLFGIAHQKKEAGRTVGTLQIGACAVSSIENRRTTTKDALLLMKTPCMLGK